MKLDTAVRAAQAIADRLRSVNGIIGTHECQHTAYRITRLWLFGSAAKGKANPNDVDILFEGIPAGLFQLTNRHRRDYKRSDRMHMRIGAARDRKATYRFVPKDSQRTALIFLRGNLKRISFHDFEVDGDLADGKILLYPRNDLGRQRCATAPDLSKNLEE